MGKGRGVEHNPAEMNECMHCNPCPQQDDSSDLSDVKNCPAWHISIKESEMGVILVCLNI